ncbi:MAG TPA: RNA methyltransferase, partial [Deltaproteobacteria bacterium]|nr:RNA methyltransferase [Deltaproteobacteria bacterium]
VTGIGGEYNPTRKEALELVDSAETLEKLIDRIVQKDGTRPLVVVTSAKKGDKLIFYSTLKKKFEDGSNLLLVFGTGWGLAEEVLRKADFLLEPIYGIGEYNHLAVRSAVAIVLDRLFGR